MVALATMIRFSQLKSHRVRKLTEGKTYLSFVLKCNILLGMFI